MLERESGGRAQNLSHLRVMHCGGMTSIKGTELVAGVSVLNLSSNNILSMAGIEALHSLVELNLSCNKI